MKYNTWENFKNKIRNESQESKQLMSEADFLTDILEAIIDKRTEMHLSQRDLAKLCNIPQSTIARIEKMNVSPNLDTLFKILQPLGLTLQIINL